MLFSVNYKSRYKAEADEIRCPVNQLGTLYSFIKEHRDKRYLIIDIGNNDKTVEQASLVREMAPNYTVQCANIPSFHALTKEGFNAYLRWPVSDWETFSTLQNIHVSDIYIDGPLCFQGNILEKVRDRPVIRVSPTVSTAAALSLSMNENSAFIRPEDLIIYDKAIDMIDFQVTEQDKEDTLFKIYKRGTYDFDLQTLIENLHVTAPNLFISSSFGKTRYTCGQICKIPGRSCHICNMELITPSKAINLFEKMKEN